MVKPFTEVTLNNVDWSISNATLRLLLTHSARQVGIVKDVSRTVRIGVLGCGTVGSGLLELLESRRSHISKTSGVDLEVAGVAVRSASKDRNYPVASELLTTKAEELVTSDDVDIVVELIGGIEPARSLCVAALEAGKPVITANKELLANVGFELYELADAHGVDFLYEASAAAAIPIVRSLRESLVGEDITRIMGIVNGTTNYILTRMDEEGADYSAVLSDAQRLGYAERDPTADVDGFDAGAKAAILASVAFGKKVVAGDVYHEGISAVTQNDIEFARNLGYVIKLLAVAELFEPSDESTETEIGVRVHPTMVPKDHPLASVRGSFNAVFVEGAAAGELMFYGRGAGGLPTASAVLGDLIDAATNLKRGAHEPVPAGDRATIRPIDSLHSAYYLNLEVVDSSGVLAEVAAAFGRHNVSILSMEQTALPADEVRSGKAEARLIFITHVAQESDMQATVADLRKLDVVAGIVNMMRVIA